MISYKGAIYVVAKKKCSYCDCDATQRLVWADGRGSVAVCNCESCKQKAIDEINENEHPEIVGFEPLNKEAAQRNPHRPMTTTERNRLRQTLKNRRPTRKVLQSFSAPVWRSIRGKIHKGCWESTFTYKIMGGPSANKSTNFTRCVGYDKQNKPTLKKNPAKPAGYEVVKKEK